MWCSDLLCVSSVLLLALTNGGQGRVTDYPFQRKIAKYTDYEPDFAQSIAEDGLEPGEMLFGDMILTQDQVEEKLMGYANEGDPEWAGMEIWIKDAAKKWPNGIVPFKKDSSLTDKMSKAVDDAMLEWHSKVCVEWIPQTTETDYVVFKKGSTCRSHLGKKGGVQYITVSDNCYDKVVVMHEMQHAIGRQHEHQRWDRDDYVTVNWDNIVDGKKNTAFTKFAKDKFNAQGISYDLKSIMHYPKWASVKSSGLSNMTPKPSTGVTEDEMGAQHPNGHMSSNDVLHINKFYDCKHLLP